MEAKCFKVMSLKTDSKYGIVARSLEELLQKWCHKFQLEPEKWRRVCLLEDGAEVDADYFSYLEHNSELIILEEGEKWNGGVFYNLNKVLNAFGENKELLKVAKQILSDEMEPKKRKLLLNLIEGGDENVAAEDRNSHEEWFKGLEKRFKTKTGYMRFNCGRRMRNYLTEVMNHADKLQKGKLQEDYLEFVARIRNKLKENNYNGCYFDRQADEESRLCDNTGWFTCQGPFDKDFCSSNHTINPYGSMENRIRFSTWNLDHKIEKKRTIIPELVKIVKQQNTEESKVEYFYRNLFTLDNLKLVDIVCHNKKAHNLSCDLSQNSMGKKPKIN
uniref:DNA fragmentation factor subunit beta n=1 Tax=Pristiophorus japonicus TaxID=55135 RepID=UPI00398F0192